MRLPHCVRNDGRFCLSKCESLIHQTHVWYLDPDAKVESGRIKTLVGLLSEQERAQYQRFHFPEDAHRYLVAHTMVRCALSRYTDIDPGELEFRHGRNGKPALANPGLQSLKFNLTHTRGLAACVINRVDECGIDAEKISTRHDPVAVAARMFSRAEHAELIQLQGTEQLEYFYSRWTLREAYVKARGIGLSFPTRKLRFRIRHAADIDIEFDGSIDDNSENWMINLWRPGTEHIAAVAVARQPGVKKALVVRRFNFK